MIFSGIALSAMTRVQKNNHAPKIVYVAAAYHFYAKGTRKRGSASQEEDVSGTSYFASLGLLLRSSRTFYLGLTLNYHNVTLSESSVGATKSDISHSYTSIYPGIELAFRFR